MSLKSIQQQAREYANGFMLLLEGQVADAVINYTTLSAAYRQVNMLLLLRAGVRPT